MFQKLVGIDYRSINEFEGFEDYKDFGGMMITTDRSINYGFGLYGNELNQLIVFETIRTVGDRAVFTLLDAMIIDDLDSNQYVMYGQCRLDGDDDSFIVVVHEPVSWRTEFFTDIIRAWRANPETNKFDVIEPTKIDCYNEGFGCLHDE